MFTGMNAGTVPKSAAIVGGGLMGAGIATAMIRAGIAVTIKEINDQAAEAAIQRVMRNLKSDTPPSLLSVTTGFQNFDTVDIVIEAAVEDVQIKQDMFKELQAKTKGDCILATNTSTINIDLVAAKVLDKGGKLDTALYLQPFLISFFYFFTLSVQEHMLPGA